MDYDAHVFKAIRVLIYMMSSPARLWEVQHHSRDMMTVCVWSMLCPECLDVLHVICTLKLALHLLS